MGKWMEVLKEKPPPGEDDLTRREPLIIGEIFPYPLMRAGQCLKRDWRSLFPTLARVRLRSPAYVGEWLWLDSREAERRLDELRRIRRLCHRQEFLEGFDGPRYYEFWRQDDAQERFEGWLDQIESLLASAVTGDCWVLLSL
jgi:hypothetical protein